MLIGPVTVGQAELKSWTCGQPPSAHTNNQLSHVQGLIKANLSKQAQPAYKGIASRLR